MSVLKILQEVAAASGKAKQKVLEKHKSNKELKATIFAAYDPRHSFYVRKVLPYQGTKRPSKTLTQALEFLHKELAERKITGDAALNKLKSFMNELSLEDAEVVELVLKRDLRMGCGGSTACKVWGDDFLFEWPVMLCAQEQFMDRIVYPAYIQLKADGMRINAVVVGDTVEYRSRSGEKVQINCPRFDDNFIEMAKGEDIVFDGELLVRDENDKILDRKTSNGIGNSAIRGSITEDEISMMFFKLWDCIPFDVFTGKKPSDRAYWVRLADLEARLRLSDTQVCEILETQEVKSEKEAYVIAHRYMAAGEEGAVLKNRNGLWQNKRVKDAVKMKRLETADLLCIGWEEGDGKYKGKIGALTVTDGSKTMETNVGTGLDDAERGADPDTYVGKIIEVGYEYVIQAKGAEKRRLYTPRFICVRHDKHKPDTL